MPSSGFGWEGLFYAILYALLYLVGVVFSVQFRRVSPNMRLLIGGFASGLVLMVAKIAFSQLSPEFRPVFSIGQVICFALIVVGMACVFSDLREQVPKEWDPVEMERPSELRIQDDIEDAPPRKQGSQQVQREEPGSEPS